MSEGAVARRTPTLASSHPAACDFRIASFRFLGDIVPPPAINLPVNADDARDLAEAKHGDQGAFRRLYDRHAAVVLSLCRSRCGGSRGGGGRAGGGAGGGMWGGGGGIDGGDGEACDACQETFIRAFAMLSRVNGEASSPGGFRRWLYAIARRVCAERRRAFSRRVRHEGAAMSAVALMIDRTQARCESAAAQAAEREALDHLTDALDQLDESEQLAIHLHYLDADPVVAAREALGLSRSAYYKLLGRARDRLAALMQKRDQTPFLRIGEQS